MSRPEALRPDTRALSEFLGQRWVLGLGAILAWMLLFHMLVNVWLLCVFTSLLVVLGGWLSSSAALDSGSLVRLERFVTLEKLQSSWESERELDREIHSTVRKIVRDFVSSWYRTVSSDSRFEAEVESAMLAVAEELKRRAHKVEHRAFAQRALELWGRHLNSYISARASVEHTGGSRGHGSLWSRYCEACTPHPATRSTACELGYARALVHLLLHVLVPPAHLQTRTGRFVVGELVTCNVLLPLVARLSDPDWLNQLVVDVFAESGQEASKGVELVDNRHAADPEQWQVEQELEVPCMLTLKVPVEPPIVTEPPTPELLAYDVINATELFTQHMQDEDVGVGPAPVSPMDYLQPGRINPFYQEQDSDLESPLSDFKKSSVESLVLIGQEALLDRLQECTMPIDNCSVVGLESEPQRNEGLLEVSCHGPGSLVESAEAGPGPELEKEAVEGEAGAPALRSNPNELLVPPIPPQACSPLSPFSFEPPSSPEGPIIIQNLRISGTITAKEHRGTGSHPYTLYTIKYETAVDSESRDPVPPVAYHMVNRRYSEFLNLQSRLEEKPELRKILKNVKGPKKIFPELPFGNMDTDKVEARKALLETFLKQLCAAPETANSDEMQEFLALNTDARIAFVKKPFIVSRIDKIVVSAIVDTLKTAFPRSEPQSPTEEADADPDARAQSDKNRKSRLRFSSKAAPVLHLAHLQPQILYCFAESSAVFRGLSLDDLECFLSEQERLAGKGWAIGMEEVSLTGHHKGSGTLTLLVLTMAETGLADVALDILCLLMRDHWSWLCTENIQKTLRLLFGTLIDRWLDVSVANLTCTQYWVVYLRVLQEAVWPGGVLPVDPHPLRTPEQKEETRRLSLLCLMKLLPDVVSDVLGSEKYRLSWEMVLESLQDAQINRHLVYCVWGLLLEFLVPESSSEGFQTALLQSLSGAGEKLSG